MYLNFCGFCSWSIINMLSCKVRSWLVKRCSDRMSPLLYFILLLQKKQWARGFQTQIKPNFTGCGENPRAPCVCCRFFIWFLWFLGILKVLLGHSKPGDAFLLALTTLHWLFFHSSSCWLVKKNLVLKQLIGPQSHVISKRKKFRNKGDTHISIPSPTCES